ncbi:MAG TPA: hypothetical protein VFX41_00100 [Actinomycetales bacterium]|nr:hypothetical protein [Actinomycetales bacterium]
MSGTFTVTAPTRLSAQEAFAAATDWSAHCRIPFTDVDITDDTGGVGTRFVGRTKIGPFTLHDPMEVVGWQPPGADGCGHVKVVKQGSTLGGDAEIDVAPAPGGGAVVRWRETILVGPNWLARLAGPFVRLGGHVVFGWVLRSQLRETESRRDRGRSGG